MYVYDDFDQALVDQRVEQFRDQTRRFLAGELSEDDFRPLRLQNGLYVQKHAPMLRIAIPYGTLSSVQLRRLADLSDRYDRGYGHFSTRQNLQLNWPALERVPDLLAELAQVQMHAIQTSGNCVRNTTTDHFAGVPDGALSDAPGFAAWAKRCVHPHRVPGYRAVTVSLKAHGVAPGDATSDQMRAVADAADAFGFGEIRVSHHQNLVLPDIERGALPALFEALKAAKLSASNVGLLTDIIACPGGDFCSLANAVSIPVALAIQHRFDDLDDLFGIGEIELNISGCINACGHHHVGHIGILGVDKAGEEWYQVLLGGLQGPDAAIGRIIGPSFSREQVPDVVAQLVDTYLSLRESVDERFIEVVRRVGIEPFKASVYGNADRSERAAA